MALARVIRGPSGACSAAAAPRLFSCSPSVQKDLAAPTPAPKSYELRTYNIHRTSWDAFVKLSSEKLHRRLEVSKCNIYLSADPGSGPKAKPFNEVTHIWEYDDLVLRAAIRKQLAADVEWQESYFKKILATDLAHQSNAILQPVPWWSLRECPSTNKHFAIRKTQMYPGKSAVWGDKMKSLLPAEGDDVPLGVWATDIGDLDSAYELYGYASAMDLMKHQQHLDRVGADFEPMIIKDKWWKGYQLAPWSQWST